MNMNVTLEALTGEPQRHNGHNALIQQRHHRGHNNRVRELRGRFDIREKVDI